MSENRDDIDWSLTVWKGSRGVQLHRLELTLRVCIHHDKRNW